LTKETTDNTCDVLVFLAVTIDVDNILENNAFLDLTLLDEFIINVFFELSELFGTSGSLPITLPLSFAFEPFLVFYLS
jgi:hypothetical protein